MGNNSVGAHAPLRLNASSGTVQSKMTGTSPTPCGIQLPRHSEHTGHWPRTQRQQKLWRPWTLRCRISRQAPEGLLQHLPELRVEVDLWASNWQAFRVQRDKLVQDTAGALKQSGKTDEAAHDLARRAVGIALTGEFGDGGEDRINVGQTGQDLDSAVCQVTPRMDPIRDARERIRAAVATCRSLVEDLVLRGGPPGRCTSCPEGARTVARKGRQGSRT